VAGFSRGAGAHEAPLNVYGYSKFLFDQIVRQRLAVAGSFNSQVVGFRYFNVYGPRESHKGRMASVAFHHYQQFRSDGKVKLFAGCDGYADGEQRRDFVHVGRCHARQPVFPRSSHLEKSGIFNVGTVARRPSTSWRWPASMPAGRCPVTSRCRWPTGGAGTDRVHPVSGGSPGKYQSFTEADLSKLRKAGYEAPFASVEEGVSQYVEWLTCAWMRPSRTRRRIRRWFV
jgi:ADP-L-glycero-D-manno-heptose 6-epimerase